MHDALIAVAAALVGLGAGLLVGMAVVSRSPRRYWKGKL